MTSSLPSLIARYAKAAMPTKTKTPTISSSFVSCMGTGPPGSPGGPVPMHDTKLELIVGVFVLVGMAALAYLAIKLGKLEVIGGGNQIEVQAEFDSVAGLKPGA